MGMIHVRQFEDARNALIPFFEKHGMERDVSESGV